MAGRPSIYGLCRDLTGLLDYSGSLRIKAIRTIKNRRKRKLPILKYFPYVKRVPLTGSHDILKSEELLLHFTDEATGSECPMVVTGNGLAKVYYDPNKSQRYFRSIACFRLMTTTGGVPFFFFLTLLLFISFFDGDPPF